MRIVRTMQAALVMASLFFLLAGKTLLLAGESKQAEPAQDRLGDPLPAGVVARLGSARLWHPATEAIHLSPDVKTATTLSIQFDPSGLLPSRTCQWDIATGKLLQERRLPQYTADSFNVSLDGLFLARYVHEENKQRLVIWDLAQNQEIQGPVRAFAHSLTFRTVLRDRKTLVYRDNDDWHLHFWDIAAMKVVKRLSPIQPRGERYKINDAVLSRDGKRVVWFLSRSERHFIQVVDEGQEKPTLEREGHVYQGFDQAALSPDGECLAWRSEWDSIHVLNLVNERNHARIRVPQTSLEVLTFSPDGNLLACEQTHWSLGRVLRLWDVGKKRFIARFFVSTAPKRWHTPVSFSQDSKTVAISADGATRIYDVTSGKERLHIAGHRTPVKQLQFAQDGRSLISSDGAVVCRWQREKTGTFDIRSSPRMRPCLEIAHLFRDDNASEDKGADGYGRERLDHAAYSLDATLKVNPGGIVLDMTALRPRKMCRLELDDDRSYRTAFVSPDNERVLLHASRRTKQDTDGFEVFDCVSGKRLARWPGTDSLNAAFSPDSRLFVWQEREHGKLLLGDLQSGEKKKDLATDLSRKPFREAFFNGSNTIDRPWHTWLFDRLAVSPDNHRVAAVWNSSLAVSAHPAQMTTDQDKEPTTLYVWDVASGKEVARIALKGAKDKMPLLTCLAFLRDGRTLAAGYLHDASVHLIEIASGRERVVLRGHQGTIRSLALSPEGRYLLSGSDDTTILVWDLDHLPSTSSRPDKASLSAKEWKQLWEDLASTDAAVAFRAIEILRRHPEQALTLLRERLQPITPVKPERMHQWIADLDSGEFAVRERATQELERLAELADPALREALKKPPSLEVRLRLQRVLETVAALTLPPERLRQVRAVEVLEAVGTDTAREHLRRLADGAAAARLTYEASESLRRLSASH